jgi:hypothetical protein
MQTKNKPSMNKINALDRVLRDQQWQLDREVGPSRDLCHQPCLFMVENRRLECDILLRWSVQVDNIKASMSSTW